MAQSSVHSGIAAPSPREAAKEAREALYRDHILAVAETVFGQEGYEGAKVQDISRLSELSMGSIYALFPGKEQIFAAIMEKRRAEFLHIIQAHTAQFAEPLACLEALSRAFIEYFHSHRDFLRMQLRLGAAWASSQNPANSPAGSEVAREIHQLQVGIFKKGVELGVFIDEDPAYLETLFSGIDQIHLGHWLSHGGNESAEELTASFLRIIRRTFVRDRNQEKE
ncbi:MAG: TetR/AcrR family transcriptional regulator [Deltaproteobacteria bacterium]